MAADEGLTEPNKSKPSPAPTEEPGKPYSVEEPPQPVPNEDRPLVDPVPPDKDLPKMEVSPGIRERLTPLPKVR
jgi:hypothetical protein